MVEAAKRAEATIVDVVFHEFNPFGISGVVVIAESHLSIHTWPEYRYAAVDIFSCGDTLKPAEAANYLVEQFGASRASCVEVKRGVFPGAAGLVNKAKEGVAADGTPEPLQMVF
jgi:S-adenosylmethionine decarboxylase